MVFLAPRAFIIKLMYKILLKQKYSRQRVFFRRLGSNLLPLTDLKDSSSPFIRRRGLKSVDARVSDMSHSQSKPGIRIRGIRARNGASRRRRFSKPGLATGHVPNASATSDRYKSSRRYLQCRTPCRSSPRRR